MRLVPSVSIIVPTLNEAGNMRSLITRIDAALTDATTYEIIFIDDHSTDNTVETILALDKDISRPNRQIIVRSKVGRRGKAFSLAEGFEVANHELICMIDADLQYPPEAIPAMLNKLGNQFDIIVASRETVDTKLVRRILSTTGRKVYGKWLYGLDCDIQSGLKLFRKVVLKHLVLDPTPWTFDLSFLVQARDAGYRIGSVSISFAKRSAGESKVNIFRVGPEIAVESLKLKLAKRNLKSYSDSPANLAKLASENRPVKERETAIF